MVCASSSADTTTTGRSGRLPRTCTSALKPCAPGMLRSSSSRSASGSDSSATSSVATESASTKRVPGSQPADGRLERLPEQRMVVRDDDLASHAVREYTRARRGRAGRLRPMANTGAARPRAQHRARVSITGDLSDAQTTAEMTPTLRTTDRGHARGRRARPADRLARPDRQGAGARGAGRRAREAGPAAGGREGGRTGTAAAPAPPPPPPRLRRRSPRRPRSRAVDHAERRAEHDVPAHRLRQGRRATSPTRRTASWRDSSSGRDFYVPGTTPVGGRRRRHRPERPHQAVAPQLRHGHDPRGRRQARARASRSTSSARATATRASATPTPRLAMPT